MSKRARAKMPAKQRAKQFMPFDAVSGLQQALRRKEHEMGLISRKELSDETCESINETLSMISRGDTVSVSFFSQSCEPDDNDGPSGEILEEQGKVSSIDKVEGTIRIISEGVKEHHGLDAETTINIDDIVSIMV